MTQNHCNIQLQTGHKTQKLKEFPDDVSADLPRMHLSSFWRNKEHFKKTNPRLNHKMKDWPVICFWQRTDISSAHYKWY